ncbi:hypothetical protein CHS0354_036248 [Potamilus streckersoni]|uniref:RING-type domain-containing protein n=1 Tax=Potamilus streckersoni TaxID=2493646 RepID=A0AAE0W1T9_9BIVA|nr:hypothetical protein CHS0354_036248 [Potamilus streckersoni]
MASASDNSVTISDIQSSDVGELNGHQCPLCLKLFTSPRQLTCNHSFCHKCLQSHIFSTALVKETEKEFSCPICGTLIRSTNEIPIDKWVYCFPRDTLLLSVLIKSKVKVGLGCDTCQAEDGNCVSLAEDFCVECKDAYCEKCSKIHKTKTLDNGHTVLNLTELGNKQNVFLQRDSLFTCKDHVNKIAVFYCKKHDSQLCSKCYVDSHINCPELLTLASETPTITETLNQVKKQITELENQLKGFIRIKKTNLGELQSQISKLTHEIRTLKQSINDSLEDLEQRVIIEGERICKKEGKLGEKLIHGCLSQMTAVRTCNAIVDSVAKFASRSQMFLLAKKLTEQHSLTRTKIEEQYTKTDNLTFHLNINPLVKAVSSIPSDEIAELKWKREYTDITTGKPLRSIEAKVLDTIEVKRLDAKCPRYTDLTFINHNYVMLVDFENSRCILLNISFLYVTSCTLPEKPVNICVAGEGVVAVTIPYQKRIQFLLVTNKSIAPTVSITTRHKCYGIAAVNQEELIVSGPCGDGKMYYWSLITAEGKEKVYHEFEGKGASQTYIALNASKTRLYISVLTDNNVHCFGLDGKKYFTYNHNALNEPLSVAVDGDDNTYMVGVSSHNIAKISSDGLISTFITNGIPKNPTAMCFYENADKFVLTCYQKKDFHICRVIRTGN